MSLLRSDVGTGQPQVSPSRGLALARVQTAAVVQRRLLAHIFDTAFAGDGRETMNFGCPRKERLRQPSGRRPATEWATELSRILQSGLGRRETRNRQKNA